MESQTGKINPLQTCFDLIQDSANDAGLVFKVFGLGLGFVLLLLDVSQLTAVLVLLLQTCDSKLRHLCLHLQIHLSIDR